MDSSQSPKTKLLTLLNVSATKPGKRKRAAHAHYQEITRKAIKAAQSGAADRLGEEEPTPESADADVRARAHNRSFKSSANNGGTSELSLGPAQEDVSDDDEPANGGAPKVRDVFDAHFASEGPDALALSKLPASAEEISWVQKRVTAGPLGGLVTARPEGVEEGTGSLEGKPEGRVLEAWEEHASKKGRRGGISPLQRSVANTLCTYSDLVHSHVALDDRPELREVVAMHAMSHVIKTRRRVLKNNEKLARAAADSSAAEPTDVRDQGFTRAKVLVLLPLRNSALEWFRLLCAFSLCPQVDNKPRFEREYNLPQGTVDKLAMPDAVDRYPRDHRETFAGNIDDSFKFGLKVTRKSVKLFSQFYESDIIVASPLGLRLSIEEDRDSDFLSSIEVLIADQMDVMLMQNWDHVQFVFKHLNKIPKSSHNTDFSRVKQWYLDGRAPMMRQSILFSSYDCPEVRALFSKHLCNVAGKHRTYRAEGGVLGQIRPGIRQTFTRFDCANLNAEHDLRFQQFTTKTLPTLLKSAVSATNTLIFIPSYFDFVRLEDHLRKMDEVSFASISEYSSNKEISRAREAFFSGKKSFLLITERFHFYRRYRIRGAKTFVFYGLPEHAHFFSEVLNFPFVSNSNLISSSKNKKGQEEEEEKEEEEEELDAGDVSAQILFSKYDLLKLERVVGSKEARRMTQEEKNTWRFA